MDFKEEVVQKEARGSLCAVREALVVTSTLAVREGSLQSHKR